MRATILFLLLSVSASAFGAEPIRAPAGPVVTADPPKPQQPGGVTLTPDLIYVVDADVEIIPVQSPQGLLKLTPEAGPLRIKGRFADDPTKIQTRTFSGKFIYTVEPVGTGNVELILIPKGVNNESEIVRRLIKANNGSIPPPTPDVDPKQAAPIPVPGFRVLIVFEQQQPHTGEVNAILYGKKTAAYLEATCVGGRAGYRIYDQNTPMLADLDLWKNAMARPRTSVPWLLISNGVTGFEGPLPKTESEFLELCKKYEVPK